MDHMLTYTTAKKELQAALREKSVFHGEFILSSGARSDVYVDCKLTTLEPKCAMLVGQVMHTLIKEEAARRGIRVQAVGGLTMGADPIALSTGIYSALINPDNYLQTFIVRKTPKTHGQTKLIEGNFKKGDVVVVIDDVVTRGDSTLAAIDAVVKEGGRIGFVAVLVDREEGGRQKIESRGYTVVSAFSRADVFSLAPTSYASADRVAA